MTRPLTEAQRLMVADGMPECLFLTADERRESWKGMRLRPTSSFADPKRPAKDEDPATKQLRKELAAAEEAKKAARLARLKELNQRTRVVPNPKQESAMSKSNAKKTPKADQVAGLRTRRAAQKGAGAAKPAARGKAASKAKPRSTAARTPAGGAPKAIRPGSKLEIVYGLLTRKEGCTTAEVLAATEWPAVSMPQQARSAGLTLRQEKDGKVTRYWGAPAA